jgi:hypothetical protein
MKHFANVAAFAIVALGGLAFAAQSTIASSPSERRAKLLSAYTPSGEPVSCVRISNIRSTHVIDNRTIDFRMTGGKTYRNTLPYSCPGLAFEERFSYRTSLSQLCSVDIINVLNDAGGRLQEGAGCGLGKFQPVTKAARPRE